MASLVITNSFSPNTTILSNAMNTNFTDISTYINNRNSATSAWDGGSFTAGISIAATTNQLVLGTTRTITITAPTPASASRTWTFPDLGTDPTVVAAQGTQTLSGQKTFSSAVTITSQSAAALLVQAAYSGGTLGALVDNSSNTASAAALVHARVAGTTAADPYAVYEISGSTVFSLGVDNSDSDIFKISQNATLGTNDFLNITTGGDVYTTAFTDYSGTSTITGWSAFTVQLIFYKKVGKLVHVWWDLQGTSDATSATFTLPFPIANSIDLHTLGFAVNNGGTAVAGLVQGTKNTSTINTYPDVPGNNWTASGTKNTRGQIFYQTT